jgi:hypothetical protein
MKNKRHNLNDWLYGFVCFGLVLAILMLVDGLQQIAKPWRDHERATEEVLYLQSVRVRTLGASVSNLPDGGVSSGVQAND